MLKLIASFGLSTQTFKTWELRHPASTSLPSVRESHRVDSSQDQGRVDHTVVTAVNTPGYNWLLGATF